MHRLAKRLLRSRLALAILLLTAFSVAVAAPCAPEFANADSAAFVFAAGGDKPADLCAPHARDVKLKSASSADDSRVLQALASFSSPVPVSAPLAIPASVALPATVLRSLTGTQLYLSTARLRI